MQTVTFKAMRLMFRAGVKLIWLSQMTSTKLWDSIFLKYCKLMKKRTKVKKKNYLFKQAEVGF